MRSLFYVLLLSACVTSQPFTSVHMLDIQCSKEANENADVADLVAVHCDITNQNEDTAIIKSLTISPTAAAEIAKHGDFVEEEPESTRSGGGFNYLFFPHSASGSKAELIVFAGLVVITSLLFFAQFYRPEKPTRSIFSEAKTEISLKPNRLTPVMIPVKILKPKTPLNFIFCLEASDCMTVPIRM